MARRSYYRRRRRYPGPSRKARWAAYKELVAAGAIGAKGSDSSKAWFGETRNTGTKTQRNLRKMFNFRGKGDYYSEKVKPFLQAHIPKGTLSKFGSMLGSSVGGDLGGELGGLAGKYGAKWLGWGDYTNQHGGGNQIMGGDIAPMTVNAADDMTGDLYFSHREFLQNITVTGTATGQSAFNNISFPLNPGLASSFPWLSQLAQNFVLYEFMGLIYEYKPTSGESGAANNALGKVIMATSYDPGAPAFINSIQMENYDYACATKPSLGLMHGVETDSKQQFGNMQYVRTGPVSRDKVFTDIGVFQFATEGVPAGLGSTVTIGELWVTYRIKLSRANLFGSLLNYNIGTDMLLGDCSGSATTLGDTAIVSSYYQPSGTLATNEFNRKLTNNIGCTCVGLSATTFRISWPANIVTGLYEITVFVGSKGATNFLLFNQVVPTASANATYTGSTVGQYYGNAAACTANQNNIFTSTYIVQVNAPGNSVATVTYSLSNQLTAAGPVANPSRIYISIKAINSAVL